MNLFKVYSALVILLVLCTYDAEGGIILLLLLKIIALKGALFFGMPLAIGSFMMGQGMGFFGGSMFGGYTMLNAAHKYSKSQALKGHHHHHKVVQPINSYVTYGPPSNGWGWSDTKHSYVTSRPDVEYGSSPHTHYHHYGHYKHHQPSLLSKITRIPSSILDRLRNRHRPHHKPPPHSFVTYKTPTNTYDDHSDHGGSYSGSSYGHNSHMHTYYDNADDTSDKFSGLSSYKDTAPGGVDWNQGLANLLKAAELANTLPSSSHDDHGSSHLSGYEHSSSDYQQPPPPPTYEDPSPGKYEPSGSGSYGDTAVGPESSVDLPPSDTVNNDYSYSHSPGIPEPSSNYGYPTDPGSPSGIPDQPSYPTQQESPYSSFPNYGDGEGQGSEESVKKVRAPNSIIEKYLEKKLKDEMDKQKNEAQRKEAAQLIAMLRQVYIQELVDSLNPQERHSRTAKGNPTTELPVFRPFPVPNSTTAKPNNVQVSTLRPPQSSTLGPAAENESTTKHLRIRSTTSKSTTTTSTPAPMTSDHMYSRKQNPLTQKTSEPTRFVRMKTSFVLNKRRLQTTPERRNPVRSRRQNSALDIQALNSFADDIKKFFLLVSILDQDKCLQKLVCDVHTRADSDSLTPYETNIIITFKVMNAMIQMDMEDSTTNYRKASKIGELSRQAGVCVKAYPSCSYSPTEIIGMGNLVAATGSVDSVTASPPTVADQESAGSETQAQVVKSPPITAMPRV